MLAFLPSLKELPWVLCGLLAIALAICFAMFKSEEAGRANDKAAQAAAVITAQTKADKLADELIIQQAIAMGVTQQKVITYVDRIQASPDDAARNVAGSNGVRDIIHGGSAASPSGPPASVSGPAASGGPK